jgi:hypothetical protein
MKTLARTVGLYIAFLTMVLAVVVLSLMASASEILWFLLIIATVGLGWVMETLFTV